MQGGWKKIRPQDFCESLEIIVNLTCNFYALHSWDFPCKHIWTRWLSHRTSNGCKYFRITDFFHVNEGFDAYIGPKKHAFTEFRAAFTSGTLQYHTSVFSTRMRHFLFERKLYCGFRSLIFYPTRLRDGKKLRISLDFFAMPTSPKADKFERIVMKKTCYTLQIPIYIYVVGRVEKIRAAD